MKLGESPVPAGAEERAWRVVRAAFEERLPTPRHRAWKPAIAVGLAVGTIAAAISPPGRAVLDDIRETVGVERAQPALFRLPAPGRLLVESDVGVWVVQPNGSKRRLGAWREASWSPFGRFVVASRRDELAALEPDGDVHWSLARPEIRFPRWGGSRTDTRIAYLTTSRLHVVAGDGKGDVDAGGMHAAARVAPAWRPGARHVLAYADTRRRVTVYDADAGSVWFRTESLPEPRLLSWSSHDRLLVVTREGLVLYGAQGQRIWGRAVPGVVTAAFAPDGRRLAVLRRGEVLLLDVSRPSKLKRVFAGAGPFAGLAWSPDGRWLLVGWPVADQWVFVRVAGARRIQAVSNVSSQFESSRFPRIAGWCCAH